MARSNKFTQPELPLSNIPAPQAPETTLEYKQRQVAAGVGASGVVRDRKVNEFAESPQENPAPRAGATHHLGGDQLKMFMTPREIEREWAPLDGDRHDINNDVTTQGTNDPRAGALTKRDERTDGAINVWNGYVPETGVPASQVGPGLKGHRYQFKRPSPTSPGYFVGEDRMETDDELWDRKYDESAWASPAGANHDTRTLYRNAAGKTTDASGVWTHRGSTGPTRQPMSGDLGDAGWYRRTGPVPGVPGAATFNSRRRGETTFVPNEEIEQKHSSMVDSIIGEGIKSPIRLGLARGSEGKPMLVGGHHRMAVARVHAPDKLAPVLYHDDIYEARSHNTVQSYKYT